MDILINDFPKFSIQPGMVKKSIVDTAFGEKLIVNMEEIVLYRESSMVIGIIDDVGFLCQWKEDSTILMYKSGEKCKVKFLQGRSCIKTIYLTCSEDHSIYTMLADLHEVENIINYTKQFCPKMEQFDFS